MAEWELDPDQTVTEPPPPGERHHGIEFMAGVGQGLLDPIEGTWQLGTHAASAVTGRDLNYMPEWARRLQRYSRSTGLYGGGGEVLGNVINPINYLPGAVIGRLGGATSLASLAARGAGEGALAAAMQPTGDKDFLANKADQLAWGGLAGGAGGVLADAWANMSDTARHVLSLGLAHKTGVPHAMVNKILDHLGPHLGALAGFAARGEPNPEPERVPSSSAKPSSSSSAGWTADPDPASTDPDPKSDPLGYVKSRVYKRNTSP
jgi:hypothetical protein